jgi:hypothetical protein
MPPDAGLAMSSPCPREPIEGLSGVWHVSCPSPPYRRGSGMSGAARPWPLGHAIHVLWIKRHAVTGNA